MKHRLYKYLLVIFFLSLCLPLFSQTQELEIYNEWFSEDCEYYPEKPFFFIRDKYEFNEFWKKTKLKGIAPYLDFEKYMIFGWTPGYTRRDCSKVYFEKLIYKDGCLQVLIDFADDYRQYVQGKRPLKIAIFPKIQPCDVFIFKKIKKGWKKYEWKPILAMWDMSGIRQRPFQYVLVDKEEEKPIQLATYEDLEKLQKEANLTEKIREQEITNIQNQQQSKIAYEQKSKVKPVTIVQTNSYNRNRQNTSVVASKPIPTSSNFNNTQNIPTNKPIQNNNKAVVSEAPINFGQTTTTTTSNTNKNNASPGMGEDPLFGSEFDITF